MSIGTIREVPEPIREAAMQVSGDADAVAWGELIGLELSGRSQEANAGVDFVYLIEKIPTEELVEFRYLLREHFGTERRGISGPSVRSARWLHAPSA